MPTWSGTPRAGDRVSPLLTMDGAVVGVVTAGTREEEFMRDPGALPQNLNWAYEDGVCDAPLRSAGRAEQPGAGPDAAGGGGAGGVHRAGGPLARALQGLTGLDISLIQIYIE